MKMLILILVIASTSTFAHNMPEDVKEKKVLSIINSKFNNLNFIDRMLERGLDQEKIEKVIIDKESLNISFTPMNLNPFIALFDVLQNISENEDVDRNNLSINLSKGDRDFELTCNLLVTEKEDFDSERFIYDFHFIGCELEDLDNGKTKDVFVSSDNDRVMSEFQF